MNVFFFLQFFIFFRRVMTMQLVASTGVFFVSMYLFIYFYTCMNAHVNCTFFDFKISNSILVLYIQLKDEEM